MEVPYVAEFAGTFLLAMTAGFCQISSTVWAMPWALASITVALTYALGPITNHCCSFNPAACVGLGLAKQIVGWKLVAGYAGVQLLGGVLAGLICTFAFGAAGELPPDARYSAYHRGGAEALYTFMFTFVMLNVRSHRSKYNWYYGLAIGLVYVAGGYAVGGISGGILNPAIAIGLRLPGFLTGTGGILNALIYSLCQVVGSGVAAGVFYVVWPQDHLGSAVDHHDEAGQRERLACEFLGAFMIVVTVGLNLLSGSTAMAWSAAACLASMTYAVGNISGAIFNPAVSLSVILSGRDKLSPLNGAIYCIVHIIAGILAGLLLGAYYIGQHIVLLHEEYSVPQGCLVEFLYTFVVVFVFLATATLNPNGILKVNHSNRPRSQKYTEEKTDDVFIALTIGLSLTAGAFAIEAIVLAGFNPAVTLGAAVANALHGGADWIACACLIVAELLGGVAAFGLFRLAYDEKEWG